MARRRYRMAPSRRDPNRPPPLKVLHVASEVAPYSKTGTMADVLAALPLALARDDVLVDVVTPRYGSIDPNALALGRRLTPVQVQLDGATHKVVIYEGKSQFQIRTLFADFPASLARPAPRGIDSEPEQDDPLQAALLARTALALEQAMSREYDLIHCHDWHGALVAAFAGEDDPPVVLTIHNLAASGRYDASWADRLGLPADIAAGAMIDGKLSLLKAGVVGADRVTTVSPRYAAEARTEAGGHGLHDALQARGDEFVGILDGADYTVWNPETDTSIAAQFSATDIAPKRRCKAALLRAFRMPVRSETPLLGMVGHLTHRKGADLVADALPQLVERGVRVVVLGTGDADLEERFRAAATEYPDRVGVRVAFDENLAHQIAAGTDFFLMPSRWEPCGLNQLYALRYGSVPIAHAVGGLVDTVEPYVADGEGTGTGFLFQEASPDALLASLDSALAVFREPASWRALQRRGMSEDFSWRRSARGYLEIYGQLCQRPDLTETPAEDGENAASTPTSAATETSP